MSIIKKHIRKAAAYKPPLDGRKEEGYLRLDFNERSTPVDPAIEEAICEFAQSKLLQVYPSYGSLSSILAQQANVDNGELMFTNGSDQGIDLVVRATCREGDEAIFLRQALQCFLKARSLKI